MLEKELMSIVTLQRRFSLASAATWMYLLALQMFLLAEMVVLDECSVHILMASPFLGLAGALYCFRVVTKKRTVFGSIDSDLRISILLIVLACGLQTIGIARIDDLQHLLAFMLCTMPAALWLLVSVIFMKVKVINVNENINTLTNCLLFTALFGWTVWSFLEIYGSVYFSTACAINSAIILFRFALSRVNQDVELRISDLLETQVYMDELTLLGNRKALYRDFDAIKKNTNNTNSTLLMVVDIDHFKQYNDTYGHVKGDDCLVFVSRTLEELFPDLGVYRYGGEEFVIFGQLSEVDTNRLLSNKMISAWMDGKMLLDEEHISSPKGKLSLSGGYGVFTSSIVRVSNAKTLIGMADKALYIAKRDRSKLVVVEDTNAELLS